MTRISLSLRTKFLLVIGLLGLVPVVGVTLNSYGLASSKQAAEQMDIARQGAQYLERINGLVYAAVMESRGIYMSSDWKTAEPYGKALLRHLAEIEATANIWKDRVIESERGRVEELGRGIAEFVTFRKELVRLAQTEAAATARAFGDNDANRKVRSALNTQLVALNKAYVAHTENAKQEVQRIEANNQLMLSALACFAVVAVAAGFIFVLRGMTRPLHALRDTMVQLADGKFDVVLVGLGRKDEIGDIARAVETFKVKASEKAQLEADEVFRRQKAEAETQARTAEERAKLAEEQTQVVDSLAEGLRSLSAGDLTFRLPEQFPETYEQIRDDFNTAISGLQDTMRAIAAATREVASTTAEISTSTTDLSQRTEEQAAGLEETSASMEEISATVKKNAENAQEANQFATGTREVADRSGAVVAQAVGAMARIEESSRKISDIINVIDEIARQTNLLALNAAVEAARAGEAGRGFAVVASEVRSLAQRSSQAAKNIKDLITNSSRQVREGVELVNKAGASLTEIMDSIKRVVEIVSEIASASAEQSTGIDQVNTALTHMDQVTQQNSALVEQNAAAVKALEQQSLGMDERVSFFRVADSAAVTEPSRVVAMAPKRPAAVTPKRPPAEANRGPVGRMQAALTVAVKKSPNWKK
jgi:methyl-accepting chemotaxis protein